MTEDIKLMDKSMEDLTVGETLKVTALVTAGSMALMLAVPAVVIGVDFVGTKIAQFKFNRKVKKDMETAEEE